MIICTTETHHGITWEKFAFDSVRATYLSGEFHIDYNKWGNWSFWDSKRIIFESPAISTALLVAREFILDNLENGFIPSWRK